MTRREILEAVLFLPAMAALALLVFGVFAGIIYAGNWLFETLVSVFDAALPRPLAFALAVMGTAAIITSAWTLVTDGWRRRKAH